MTKKDIINFLEPFKDDISIGVKSSDLMAPYTYKLKYIPADQDFDERIVIHQIGTVVLKIQ